MYAIALEHLDIVKLLQQSRANFKPPRISRIAFDVVARRRLESMAETLLQEGAEPTNKAVVTALEHGHHIVAGILHGHVHDITIEVAGLWISGISPITEH